MDTLVTTVLVAACALLFGACVGLALTPAMTFFDRYHDAEH